MVISVGSSYACSSSTIIPETEISVKDPTDHFSSLLDSQPDDLKEVLLVDIEHLEDKTNKMAQVCEIVLKKNYEEHLAFIQCEMFEYYALACVHEGMLSDMQFGTLMFVRAAIMETPLPISDFRVQPLFVGDDVAETASELILKTFYAPLEPLPLAGKPDLLKFFELAQKLPESEKSFIYFPQTEPVKKKRSLKENIFNALYYIVRFNLFGLFSMGDQYFRMIPSFGMLQAFLDATRDDGFFLLPRLGNPPLETTRITLKQKNAREFSIHCPQIAPVPSSTDIYKTTPFNYMYYQMYLVWTTGCIPLKDRVFYCHLAKVIKEHKTEEPNIKKVCQKVHDLVILMEFTRYRDIVDYSDMDLDERRESTVDWIQEQLINEVQVYQYPRNPSSKLQKEFQRLQRNVFAVYGAWMIYKQDYTNVNEINHLLETMSKKQRKKFSANVMELVKYNCSTPKHSIIPMKDLRMMPTKQIAQVVALKNVRWWGLEELQRLGFPFKLIWGLPKEQRKKIVADVFFEESLLRIGVKRSYLLSLTEHQREIFLTYYDQIWIFLYAGVKLKTLLNGDFGSAVDWITFLENMSKEATYDEKIKIVKTSTEFVMLFD